MLATEHASQCWLICCTLESQFPILPMLGDPMSKHKYTSPANLSNREESCITNFLNVSILPQKVLKMIKNKLEILSELLWHILLKQNIVFNCLWEGTIIFLLSYYLQKILNPLVSSRQTQFCFYYLLISTVRYTLFPSGPPGLSYCSSKSLQPSYFPSLLHWHSLTRDFSFILFVCLMNLPYWIMSIQETDVEVYSSETYNIFQGVWHKENFQEKICRIT